MAVRGSSQLPLFELVLALALALIPASGRAFAVSAGEPLDAPFLPGDTDSERVCEAARALERRGHPDLACAYAACRLADLSRTGAARFFVADPSMPGHFFGARESLLRVMRGAAPESRLRAASAMEGAAHAALAEAAAERDGPGAAAAALGFPFTRAGAKAMLLAADMLAEEGRLSEALDLLRVAGPDFPDPGASEQTKKRLQFLDLASGRAPVSRQRPSRLKLAAKVFFSEGKAAALPPADRSVPIDLALVHSRGCVRLRSGSAPRLLPAVLGSVVSMFGKVNPPGDAAVPSPETCSSLDHEGALLLFSGGQSATDPPRAAVARLSAGGEPELSNSFEPWQFSKDLNNDDIRSLIDTGAGAAALLSSRTIAGRKGAAVQEYRLARLDSGGAFKRWTRFVCAAEMPRENRYKPKGAVLGPVAILEAGGVCCVLTDCGLLAGFASFDGAPLWALAYKRDRRVRTDLRRAVFGAQEIEDHDNPGGSRLLSDGEWFAAAPADSTQVLAAPCRGGQALIALNTVSGGIGNDFRTLVAFERGMLLVGLADRIVALDSARRFGVAWVAHGKATGLKGGFAGVPTGRGVTAGGACLFPTTAGVFAVEISTGAPIQACSHHFGWNEEQRAALIKAGDFFVAVGRNRIWVFAAE